METEQVLQKQRHSSLSSQERAGQYLRSGEAAKAKKTLIPKN
jgi:hypothetical protein